MSPISDPDQRPDNDLRLTLVDRWHFWRYKWLPYRTTEWRGLHADGSLDFGPRRWHLPEIISDRLLP